MPREVLMEPLLRVVRLLDMRVLLALVGMVVPQPQEVMVRRPLGDMPLQGVMEVHHRVGDTTDTKYNQGKTQQTGMPAPAGMGFDISVTRVK
mmetsp:Transcript_20443/g.29583  ORF Transcript_20443/g.29583 Transcript_20443/m.29583 type:complete len:92 (-) Transcript_20443:484-759(-)